MPHALPVRRLISYAVSVALTAGVLLGGATAAEAAAVPVDPGPIAKGRPIIGTGQNLPPLVGSTYNIGPYPAAEVEAYYTGKQIQQDRQDVTTAAWRWVRDWAAANCGTTKADVTACKATVVFDVDETMLNSYTYSLAQDPQFSFNETTWNAYVAACGYAGIPQTRDLFNKVKKLGLGISLISAGSVSNKGAMVPCLHKHGIHGWDRYIMRGQAGASLTDGEWKAQERKQLQRKGLVIVASVGDQVSDMSYGHLLHGFLLPNTMYLIG